MGENTLDCRGMSCPIPIIKLNEFVKVMGEGDLIEIIADDPTFISDISVWCKRMNYDLLSLDEQDAIIAKVKLSQKD